MEVWHSCTQFGLLPCSIRNFIKLFLESPMSLIWMTSKNEYSIRHIFLWGASWYRYIYTRTIDLPEDNSENYESKILMKTRSQAELILHQEWAFRIPAVNIEIIWKKGGDYLLPISKRNMLSRMHSGQVRVSLSENLHKS